VLELIQPRSHSIWNIPFGFQATPLLDFLLFDGDGNVPWAAKSHKILFEV
jgi:hypothetical protein